MLTLENKTKKKEENQKESKTRKGAYQLRYDRSAP